LLNVDCRWLVDVQLCETMLPEQRDCRLRGWRWNHGQP